MNISPIFLLGSERSGTNLLRSRLDNHSNIAAPVPIHFLKWFYSREPYYGDLTKEKNFKTLVEYVIMSINTHPHPWDINLNYEIISQDIPLSNRSVVRLFEYLYDTYTKKNRKKRWFCKDNFLSKYAWKLRDYFPESKFIYLVRDPRDVCLSDMKRNGGHYSAFTFSKSWKNEQDRCIRIYTDSAFEDKVILIKYEDILTEPKNTFKNICSFINENFETTMLNPGRRPEASKSQQWKNVSKKIMSGNKKKYIEGLSHRQVKIIESNVWKEMKFLGYYPEFEDSKSYNLNVMEKTWYLLYENIKKIFPKLEQSNNEKKIRRKRQLLKKSI